MYKCINKMQYILAVLCCVMFLLTACGKKGPPTPLSKVIEQEQEKQQTSRSEVQDESDSGEKQKQTY